MIQEGEGDVTAIAVYHVSDGIDQCRVGFLPRHMIKHHLRYNGVLAQVTEIYSSESDTALKRKKYHHNRGCCIGALISFPNNKKKRSAKLASKGMASPGPPNKKMKPMRYPAPKESDEDSSE